MNTGKTRVLVVDDEPAMRAMAKGMLESMGFEATLANSGEQAVDLYHQSLLGGEEGITMAIMDLTLPGGMSGVEALHELQEMDADFPVVASSGYLEDNATEICQKIGFVGVLPKPYTADNLKQLVDWVVSQMGVPGGFSEGMPQPEPEVKKEEEPAPKNQHPAEPKGGDPVSVPPSESPVSEGYEPVRDEVDRGTGHPQEPLPERLVSVENGE